MKSVCLVVQNVYDIDVRVRRKAEALVSAGYSVDVLALAATDGKKNYALKGVNVYTLPLNKERGALTRYAYEYVTFFLWTFVRLLTGRKRYDVVDVNTLPDFLIFAAAPARWKGAKLVLDMHEITPEFYISKYGVGAKSWMIHLLTLVERISFNFADQVITINEPIQELLIQRGLNRSRSLVVMNSADEARFASSVTQAPGGGDSDAFVMMYHGTLTRLYGLDIAIEAFKLAHTAMPGSQLCILGSGPEKQNLTDLVEKYGLTAKIKLPGSVPASEIPGWLEKCDAGILPLRRDVFLDFAFPNKLPEFIIMGKAVLMSRLSAIKHYFSEEALCYFEASNPADLAKQMVRLYLDRALRARLAARARQEYAPLSWDLMAERYLKLVAELSGSAYPTTRKSDVGIMSATGR